MVSLVKFRDVMKVVNRIFRTLILLSSFNLTSSLAHEKSLSFCYETWVPFIYSDDKGKLYGKHYQLLTQALEPKGFKLTFIQHPYLRCIQQLKNGKVDFALHVDDSDGLKLIDYQMDSWDLIFAYQPSLTWRFDANGDNSQYKVLISKDYSYPKAVMAILEKSKIQIIKSSFYTNSAADVKRQFKLVNSGFVDAILVDKTWVEYEMQRLDITLQLSNNILYSQPQFIGYSANNESKAKMLKKILTDFKKNLFKSSS